MKINDLLKIKRIESQISQQELARMLGYKSGQFVSNWERGACLPPTKALKKLCKALSIPKNQIRSLYLKELETRLGKHLSENRKRK